jgi:glycosyltransferase involved in cell wall biosynthesis
VTIAVVVPARNAAHLIGPCLDAISQQTRPAHEVLVLVGPSDDGTRDVAARHPLPGLRVVDNPAGDRASAINLAIEMIRSDVIAMVDAQATLDPDYLAVAIELLGDPSIAVVGGPMRPQGTTSIGQAMAAALQSPFGVGDSLFHFEGGARDADSVYLGVYRRSVFDRIGSYNVALLRTEDDDLNARVRAVGMRIRLDPRLGSTYRCRDSLGAVWRQYFGYGYWKVALGSIRSGALRARHLVPALFVVAVLIGLGAAVLGAWIPLVALGGTWLVASVVAAALAPARSAVARLLFPVVALTMHVAYGTGTLVALLALPRLRRRASEGARQAERRTP